MKKLIKEYLNIIASAIIGFVFILTSFYFVINYYHSDELKQNVYIGENDVKHVNYKNTIDKIKNNLDLFNSKKSTNEYYKKLYHDLLACHTVMTNKDLYYSIETNRFYEPYEIYQLGENFQSKVLNSCWAFHISSINNEDNDEHIKTIAPFISNNVNNITKQNQNALEELQSNSSYFFTTRISSLTVRNYLKSDYNTIVDSYQDFANIVLSLSELINNGGNDD